MPQPPRLSYRLARVGSLPPKGFYAVLVAPNQKISQRLARELLIWLAAVESGAGALGLQATA